MADPPADEAARDRNGPPRRPRKIAEIPEWDLDEKLLDEVWDEIAREEGIVEDDGQTDPGGASP